jgi:hypothetical protein
MTKTPARTDADEADTPMEPPESSPPPKPSPGWGLGPAEPKLIVLFLLGKTIVEFLNV